MCAAARGTAGHGIVPPQPVSFVSRLSTCHCRWAACHCRWATCHCPSTTLPCPYPSHHGRPFMSHPVHHVSPPTRSRCSGPSRHGHSSHGYPSHGHPSHGYHSHAILSRAPRPWCVCVCVCVCGSFAGLLLPKTVVLNQVSESRLSESRHSESRHAIPSHDSSESGPSVECCN